MCSLTAAPADVVVVSAAVVALGLILPLFVIVY